MQVYEMSIDFASIPMAGNNSTSTVSLSLPADRFFSWISLGWIRLFGVEDYRSTLQTFLSGHPSWRHSDLFLFKNDSVWLPAPRWTKDAAQWRKAARTSAPPAKNASSDRTMPSPELNADSKIEEDSEADSEADLSNFSKVKPTVSALRESGSLAGPEQLSDSNTLVRAEAFLAAVQQGRPIRRHEVSSAANQETFKDTCSYHGWLATSEAPLIEKLRACMEFMSDEGFGANRSTGHGTIKSASISATELSEKLQASDNRKFTRHVILSACCPTPEFIELLEATPPGSNNYSLAYNSGWVYDSEGRATNVRKPVTCAFETGSVFSCMPEGRLVEVGNEDYPSFRYGFPFVLSV